jgi:GntP family gluconate:H+ symporter
MDPLFILGVGMAAILGGILVLRLNAFVALIAAAIIVSLLAPGEGTTRITRVAEAFGRTAGTIGIVIGLAAIIGRAMMDSGAADRIVTGFFRLLGRERGAHALTASGFVLSIPVFFDTVFYLLAPLAGSMYRQTGRHDLCYMMAIAAGAVATHTLVPPTPGPLAVAGLLGVDLGMMILIGGLVALPAAAVGLLFSAWVDARMPVPLRSTATVAAEHVVRTGTTPGLFLSLLPVVLPVVLIATNTIALSVATTPGAVPAWLLATTATLGNANLALLVSAGARVVGRRQIYERAGPRLDEPVALPGTGPKGRSTGSAAEIVSTGCSRASVSRTSRLGRTLGTSASRR